MTIVLLVVIPVSRMYGVFDDGARRRGRDNAASSPCANAQEDTKER